VGALLPSISCVLDEKKDFELLIVQCNDAGLYKKPIQHLEISIKANTKQTTEDSKIYHNAETSALSMSSSRSSEKKHNIVSRSRQYVGKKNYSLATKIKEAIIKNENLEAITKESG